MTRPSRKTTSFAGWSSTALVEAAWVIKSKMVNEKQLRDPGEYDVVLLSFPSWIVRVMQTAWPKHECASTLLTSKFSCRSSGFTLFQSPSTQNSASE